MKQIVFIVLLLCGTKLAAQTFPNFSTIRFSLPSDYRSADSTVLLATDYLLSTPFDKNNTDRLKSTAFVIKWMTATPDYTFSLDQAVLSKITSGSDDLLGLYMICMAKYVLENKETAKDEKLAQLNGLKILLHYAGNEANEVPLNNPLIKLIKADKKGKLTL